MAALGLQGCPVRRLGARVAAIDAPFVFNSGGRLCRHCPWDRMCRVALRGRGISQRYPAAIPKPRHGGVSMSPRATRCRDPVPGVMDPVAPWRGDSPVLRGGVPKSQRPRRGRNGLEMSDEPVREHVVRALFDVTQDPEFGDETTVELLLDATMPVQGADRA